jgi:hypothetical protein
MRVGSVSNVSEMYAAYFFTAELFGVGGLPCKYRYTQTSTLKMEAACTSETLATAFSHARNIWYELLCIPVYI